MQELPLKSLSMTSVLGTFGVGGVGPSSRGHFQCTGAPNPRIQNTADSHSCRVAKEHSTVPQIELERGVVTHSSACPTPTWGSMQPKKFMQEARIRGKLPQMISKSHCIGAWTPNSPLRRSHADRSALSISKQRERHALCRTRNHTHLKPPPYFHSAVPLIER
jgi:hypothetical protein